MYVNENGQKILVTDDRHSTSNDAEDNVSNGVVLQLKVGDVSIQVGGHFLG